MNKLTNTKNYQTFLKEIKEQIRTSQTRVISSANSEMIILYYNIGKAIHQKQEREGWGAKVIEKISLDLKNELPKIKGFSQRNIKRMVRFYREYSDITFMPQAVAQIEQLIFSIPWGHNTVLIEKIEEPK
jgi:predicted nuclease of restriction endonuclease-like (RecB) superfamily